MKVPFLDLVEESKSVESELLIAAERVVCSGRYVLGAEVEGFEREFARYVGTPYCVGTGTGLDALRFCLQARGVGAGDEVIVPSNTYIATWLAVSATGATPIPADPNPTTLTLDGASVSAALTERTAGVIPVHLYGVVADVGGIRQAIGARDLFILEDAAQAHGAHVEGKRAGSLADAAGFSFYPSKNLGALGDGGAVTTSDAELADSVRLLRNYGSRTKYLHEVAGANSRLDEIQAAFLRVKLAHLSEWNDARQELAKFYIDQLEGIDGLILPPSAPSNGSYAWHVFVVHHVNRDALRKVLAAEGIGTQMYYPKPPHLSPAYSHLGYKAGSFPIAERSAATNVALPFSAHLKPRQREAVVAAVRDACKVVPARGEFGELHS